MKIIRWFLLLILALTFPLTLLGRAGEPSSAADQWKKADELFEKKLYQEAQKEYEPFLRAGPTSASDGEGYFRAIYRIAECEALQFKYGEALQRIAEVKMPEPPRFPAFPGAWPGNGPRGLPFWRARLLILKAELYREFLKQYGFSSSSDVVEGENDLTRRTPEQMHQEINSSYNSLWDLKETLLSHPLQQEAYFLDLKGIEEAAYPTLWDFVLLRWADYLLNEAPEDKSQPKQKALDFLQEEYVLDFQIRDHRDLTPERRAAFLMDQASRMGGLNALGSTGTQRARGEAAERWKIARLLIPFHYPGKVSASSDWKEERKAAVATLSGWMSGTPEGHAPFKHPGSRALAGYEAAEILNQDRQYEASLSICQKVETDWPQTLGARKCRKLAAQIKAPSLSLSAEMAPPSGQAASGGQKAAVTTRNIREVYCRLYRTTPDELAKVATQSYRRQWSQILHYAEKGLLELFLKSRTPGFSWTTAIKDAPPSGKDAPPSSIHESKTTPVDFPSESLQGIYLLVVSQDREFKAGESLISGIIVNFTDLILVGTTGCEEREEKMIFVPGQASQKTVKGFHLYALNAFTGRPVSHARLNIQLYENYGAEKRLLLETGQEGMAQVPVSLQLVPDQYNSFQIDPLASRAGGPSGESYAYWSGAAYLGYTVPPPIRLFVDTDRPIYRPGQTVRAKVTVVTRIPQGFSTYRGTSRVLIQALDTNGQELYRVEKAPNEMGSLSAQFVIPPGRLLGNYSISASMTEWNHSFRGSGSFAVEEYKRPEFEVKLKEAKGPWRFGQKAEVEGDVRYYFGGPVPEAPLVAKIYRETYRPWFCWWWAWRVGGSDRNEMSRESLKTDKNGHFSLSFVPQASDPREPDPLPARFTVEVEARDQGGRTITGEESYLAGKSAYLFSVELPFGFLTAGRSAALQTKLMNLNEKAVAGKARYEVYEVPGDPKHQEPPAYWWGYFPESPSLDMIYKEIPNGKKVAEGDLSFPGEKSVSLDLQGLRPGAHRLTLKAQDPWGGEVVQSIIFLAVDPASEKIPLKIPSLTIPEQKEYQVGEKARILLGSSDLKEAIHVEVWGGQFLLSHRLLQGVGIRVLEIPVTSEHKGGFTVRWFGVKEFKIRAGYASLQVPWKEKNLVSSLRFDRKLKPGQKATWLLTVHDRNGNPVNGEALVTMYDRSLEYYAKFSSSWADGLYPQRPSPQEGTSSIFQGYATEIPVEKGWIKKILDLFREALNEPEPPMLRLNKSRVRGYYRGRSEMAGNVEEERKMEAPAEAPAVPASSAVPQKAGAMRETDYARSKEKGGKGGGGLPPAQLRSQFAETALFRPQLPIKNGEGIFSFQVPEQLTGWRILVQALTRDIKTGMISEETMTQKELMVRVEIPRFFREGDLGTIKAVVHNETGAPLSGEISLSVLHEPDSLRFKSVAEKGKGDLSGGTFSGQSAAEKLSLKDLYRKITIKPHSLTSLSWPVSVPRGVTAYKVRAVARCGSFSDAEERDLPILPSRQRLIETQVVALNGDLSKTLSLRSREKVDPTREEELLQLQIDPQLALTVLNSVPFLVKYPHECVEQVLNRYVPLAIVNELYRKNPDIARATSKIPRRETITPSWERSDSRRMMTLMETPWEEISKGRRSFWPIIDMLEPKTVASEKEDALGKLKAAQLSSGAFPWFPGGPEDPYMTLYVLDGFAQAQKYGVSVPEEVIRKALNFVNQEIPKRLKPDEGDLSLILYAAYVVTSYPQSYPEAKLGYTFAKAWIDFADRHTDALTPYGEALAAFVYWRLGEKAKGNSYLDRAMDGSREDPLTGVYWTPEKNSWLWYNDTLEKHAFFLRTLQTIRPRDPRIPGMVQWIIFNRKGNEWKSTKASAAAIYALLDYLRGKGALEKGDLFTVRWGAIKESKKVEPHDWLASPLQWRVEPAAVESKVAGGGVLNGKEINPEYSHAVVEKKGPGLAFASLTWIYSTDQIPEPSEPGVMGIERKFYLRVKEKEVYHLKPLGSGDVVHVGDQIEVQVKVRTRSQFEYVHLKDPRGAGFEAEELRSGWKWDQIARYEEPRDSLTNFFFNWVPHGEYILKYRVRPTTPGRYRIGAAILQSMYAPEFSAHSGGFELAVQE